MTFCWSYGQKEPIRCKWFSCCRKRVSSWDFQWTYLTYLGLKEPGLLPLGYLWIIAIDPVFLTGRQIIKYTWIRDYYLNHFPTVTFHLLRSTYFEYVQVSMYNFLYSCRDSKLYVYLLLDAYKSRCSDSSLNVLMFVSLPHLSLFLASFLKSLNFLCQWNRFSARKLIHRNKSSKLSLQRLIQ